MTGKRIVVGGLFALVALALTVFASSGTEAGTYKVLLDYSLSSYGAGDNANTVNDIKIAIPDYNYEDTSMFTFNSIDWSGHGAMGYTFPIGAGMGVLNATSTTGLTGGPCSTKLTPDFDLYNASIDTTDVLSAADTYWILKKNDEIAIPKSYGDPDLEDYLEKYPYFLNEMFDPDGPHGPLEPLKPRARYAGYSLEVANMNILVEVVVFNPGQLSQLPGIYAQMDSTIGQPSVVVLNNPVSQEEAPGAISDFCTPLITTTTTFGVATDNTATAGIDESDCGGGPGSCIIQSNPAASKGVLGTGTHLIRNYSRSERDADGDGWENDLDPCHYTDDSGWDPRASGAQAGQDSDADGLPDSCDPEPNGTPDGAPDCVVGAPQNDCDKDGYDNRQDICPLVADGCKDSVCNQDPNLVNPAWTNQADSEAQVQNADLGPGPDSMGDACDDSDDDGWEAGGVAPSGPGYGNCDDGIDNDGDNLIDGNDPECSATANAGMDAWELGQCRNDTDEDPADDEGTPDYGKWINDGCPVKGATSEASISGACDAYDDVDDDGDTRVNDGCGTKGSNPEAAGDTNDSDIWGTNPGTGTWFHDMPWAAVCVGGTDTDGDGYCDGLEDLLGATTLKDNGSEADLAPGECVDSDCCGNDDDDDSDGYVNDGCPMVGKYIERGAECANATSDDTDVPNLCDDGTTGGPDCAERTLGPAVNDGCPVIGVPESLVIDYSIVAGSAQPTNAVPQSCSDGIDNDGDTTVDTDTGSLSCDSGDASYASDSDFDGKVDASDNCPSTWNPEQTNTDGHHKGDACDADDDDDAWTDIQEWNCQSDPFKAASKCEVCNGLDDDGDGQVDEGFADTTPGGPKDCVDPAIDSDSDTVPNSTDTDCDDANDGAQFTNAQEDYLTTARCTKCGQGNDPYDTAAPYGAAINTLDLFAFVSSQALGGSISDDNANGTYVARYDLNQAGAAKGTINTLDLFVYVNKQALGAVCGTGY